MVATSARGDRVGAAQRAVVAHHAGLDEVGDVALGPTRRRCPRPRTRQAPRRRRWTTSLAALLGVDGQHLRELLAGDGVLGAELAGAGVAGDDAPPAWPHRMASA